MKFLSAQLSHFLADRRLRQNLRALAKVAAGLGVIVLIYAVIFHVIMVYHEGQDHSWITGVYWALTVMSTLGFGDITFETDLGRAFTVFVLISGIILLLIVLPFAFIRFFYAPWIETELKTRTRREVAEGIVNHVLICMYDPLGRDLVRQLQLLRIPYYVLVEDHGEAAELDAHGISVIAGNPAYRSTWEGLQLDTACAVVANNDDMTNTNITVTVRGLAPDLMVVATATEADSIDILELAGATEVLAVKHRLGAELANRVNAGHTEAHAIGKFAHLVIAEVPVHNTPWAGKALGDVKLSEALGLRCVGVWERGVFHRPDPDVVLRGSSVPVVMGTQEQISELNEVLYIYDINDNPALVIGGGKVGCAAAQTLRDREVPVHLVERDEEVAAKVEGIADRVIVGDAADRSVLVGGGIEDAPAAVLTTNDDSINIYLALYCRRLNPGIRIVCRVTQEENADAAYRAGADFVLSYSALGAENVTSAVQDRELMMLGSGTDLFPTPVTDEMLGKTLAELKLDTEVGLSVVALRTGEDATPTPATDRPLAAGSELLLLGTPEQHNTFVARYLS